MAFIKPSSGRKLSEWNGGKKPWLGFKSLNPTTLYGLEFFVFCFFFFIRCQYMLEITVRNIPLITSCCLLQVFMRDVFHHSAAAHHGKGSEL